jgi:hypothetical protein
MSINVNVFLELVGKCHLQTEFSAEIEIWAFRRVIMRFPRQNRQILTEWQIGTSFLQYPVIIGLHRLDSTSAAGDGLVAISGVVVVIHGTEYTHFHIPCISNKRISYNQFCEALMITFQQFGP